MDRGLGSSAGPGKLPVPTGSLTGEITYKHDVAGRRVEKDVDGYTTRYVHDGGHIIAEYDGNNNLLRKYIYGPGTDQPVSMIEVDDNNATYYYHFDALGSVVALSDSTGDTVQTYEYSVYGEVSASDPNHPNPYMFAGRRFDIEIGLYYNRARYYNPYTGRFLQTDPIGYEGGMNLYQYCGNNPLNFLDPSGLVTICDGNCVEEALGWYLQWEEGPWTEWSPWFFSFTIPTFSRTRAVMYRFRERYQWKFQKKYMKYRVTCTDKDGNVTTSTRVEFVETVQTKFRYQSRSQRITFSRTGPKTKHTVSFGTVRESRPTEWVDIEFQKTLWWEIPSKPPEREFIYADEIQALNDSIARAANSVIDAVGSAPGKAAAAFNRIWNRAEWYLTNPNSPLWRGY